MRLWKEEKTLWYIVEWLKTEHGVMCSDETVRRAVADYERKQAIARAEALEFRADPPEPVVKCEIPDESVGEASDDDLLVCQRDRLAKLSGVIWTDYRAKNITREDAAGHLLAIGEQQIKLALARAKLRAPAPVKTESAQHQPVQSEEQPPTALVKWN